MKVSSNAALQMSVASSFHREGPTLAKAVTEGFKHLDVRKSSSCAAINSFAAFNTPVALWYYSSVECVWTSLITSLLTSLDGGIFYARCYLLNRKLFVVEKNWSQ